MGARRRSTRWYDSASQPGMAAARNNVGAQSLFFATPLVAASVWRSCKGTCFHGSGKRTWRSISRRFRRNSKLIFWCGNPAHGGLHQSREQRWFLLGARQAKAPRVAMRSC